MATAYIISDYGKLGKHDDTLVFTNKDGERVVIFPYKTEMLVLVGRVSISADALCLLARHKIQTVLVSKKGEFNGKLVFGESKNVFLRQKQYNLLSDGKASLEVARSIVTGKIRNSLSFIQRIKRNRNENDEEATARIDEAVLLSSEGLKKVIAAFEEKMKSEVLYAPLKQKISYTKIIFEQANQYKRFVGGEETCYKPYYFK